jgi:hypothetical protein
VGGYIRPESVIRVCRQDPDFCTELYRGRMYRVHTHTHDQTASTQLSHSYTHSLLSSILTTLNSRQLLHPSIIVDTLRPPTSYGHHNQTPTGIYLRIYSCQTNPAEANVEQPLFLICPVVDVVDAVDAGPQWLPARMPSQRRPSLPKFDYNQTMGREIPSQSLLPAFKS